MFIGERVRGFLEGSDRNRTSQLRHALAFQTLSERGWRETVFCRIAPGRAEAVSFGAGAVGGGAVWAAFDCSVVCLI